MFFRGLVVHPITNEELIDFLDRMIMRIDKPGVSRPIPDMELLYYYELKDRLFKIQ